MKIATDTNSTTDDRRVPPVPIARSATQPGTTAGERWVERYLLPLMRQRLADNGHGAGRCLQIEPEDETEAIRLRTEGYHCDVVLLDGARSKARAWQQAPLVCASVRELASIGSYDLITMGHFGKITGNGARRVEFARTLAAICRKRGAFLTTIGNRLCPIDFSGNAGWLHSPFSKSLVTLREMEKLFLGTAGFSAVHPLTLVGHFEMGKAAGMLKVLAWVMKLHWQVLAVPERRWIYASPLNPTLMLWIER